MALSVFLLLGNNLLSDLSVTLIRIKKVSQGWRAHRIKTDSSCEEVCDTIKPKVFFWRNE